jgi:hypothetical protein
MATSPDVDTLEREAAEARARLAGTLERLNSPQTAVAVKQELTDYAQGLKDNVLGTGRDRAQGYAGDLKARALANPLGLAMIGAGIGWHLYRHPPITTLLVGTGIAMLMKGDSGRRLDASSYRNPYDREQPRGYVPGGVAGYGYPVTESPPGTTLGDRASTAVTHAGHVARDLSARVQDAAHAVAERVSGTAESLTTTTLGAAEAARTALGHAAETTREAVMGAADTARTAVSGAADSARSAVSGAAHAAGSTGSSVLDRGTSAVGYARDTTMRQAGQVVDLAQRNPLLLGALGIAAGTALMYALRSAESGEYRERPLRRGERVGQRSGPAQRAGSRQGGDRSAQSRPAPSRSAGDTASSGREGGAGIAGRLSETAEGVAASAADLASGVASTAGRALGAAGDAVSSSASSAYGAASSVARSAADVAYSAARRAPRAPAYVQDQISDLGERYPLLLGAVSIALGAAVGGALRLSESENRLMGPISDRLKQRAWEVADEQYGVAREAAEHFAGELQTRFAGGNGQDQSADFETVLGGGQPPVGGEAAPSASPTAGMRPGGAP